MPRAERVRIVGAVLRGRATADPGDSANAAAYAEWLLSRHALVSRRAHLGSGAVRLALLLGVFVYLGIDANSLQWAAVWAGIEVFATWSVLRRQARTKAALAANRTRAEIVAGVADIEFPQPDPKRLSPWTIRPRFALIVGAIVFLMPAALGVAAYTSRPHDHRSHAVRAVDAACQREHDALQALRGSGLSNADWLTREAAIELRLMREIEAGVAKVDRPPSLNLMLGWQNQRIIALEDQAGAARANDRRDQALPRAGVRFLRASLPRELIPEGKSCGEEARLGQRAGNVT